MCPERGPLPRIPDWFTQTHIWYFLFGVLTDISNSGCPKSDSLSSPECVLPEVPFVHYLGFHSSSLQAKPVLVPSLTPLSPMLCSLSCQVLSVLPSEYAHSLLTSCHLHCCYFSLSQVHVSAKSFRSSPETFFSPPLRLIVAREILLNITQITSLFLLLKILQWFHSKEKPQLFQCPKRLYLTPS